MKKVYRQDGSLVELTDAEAANWIKQGLATEKESGETRGSRVGAKQLQPAC